MSLGRIFQPSKFSNFPRRLCLIRAGIEPSQSSDDSASKNMTMEDYKAIHRVRISFWSRIKMLNGRSVQRNLDRSLASDWADFLVCDSGHPQVQLLILHSSLRSRKIRETDTIQEHSVSDVLL
jgi:hypothetical protein